MALPFRATKVDGIHSEALDGPLYQALPLLCSPLSHLDLYVDLKRCKLSFLIMAGKSLITEPDHELRTTVT